MDQNDHFKGKITIITGAASGLGKELSSLFVKSGATVAMFDINKEALEIAAGDNAAAYGRTVYSKVVDVSKYDAFKKAVDETVEELGLPDIFINNAGIGVSGEFVSNTVEEINAITSVNYLGMIYGSRIILDHFYKQGYGHLVNMASVAGLVGFARMSLYCGAKFGILGFSQSIRHELKRHGIDISVALPSTTATPMILDKLDEDDDKIPGVLFAIPVCDPAEVAQAVFKGIMKKRFMIFPTPLDMGTYYLRNLMPWAFDIYNSLFGFRDFKKKREELKQCIEP